MLEKAQKIRETEITHRASLRITFLLKHFGEDEMRWRRILNGRQMGNRHARLPLISPEQTHIPHQNKTTTNMEDDDLAAVGIPHPELNKVRS
jgi:hypothetical protein